VVEQSRPPPLLWQLLAQVLLLPLLLLPLSLLLLLLRPRRESCTRQDNTAQKQRQHYAVAALPCGGRGSTSVRQAKKSQCRLGWCKRSAYGMCSLMACAALALLREKVGRKGVRGVGADGAHDMRGAVMGGVMGG
jgi:hypothetical protein